MEAPGAAEPEESAGSSWSVGLMNSARVVEWELVGCAPSVRSRSPADLEPRCVDDASRSGHELKRACADSNGDLARRAAPQRTPNRQSSSQEFRTTARSFAAVRGNGTIVTRSGAVSCGEPTPVLTSAFGGIVVEGGGESFDAAGSSVVALDAGAMSTVFESVAGDEVSGEVFGEVSGEAVGEVSGEAVGEVSGEAVGEVSGEAVGEVSGEAVGEVSGEVFGEVPGGAGGEVSVEAGGESGGGVGGFVAADWVSATTVATPSWRSTDSSTRSWGPSNRPGGSPRRPVPDHQPAPCLRMPRQPRKRLPGPATTREA